MNRFARVTADRSRRCRSGSCLPAARASIRPTSSAAEMFNTKKKLPGERRAVFPEGTPGVPQGVPQELVKGYQPPAEPEPPAAPSRKSPSRSRNPSPSRSRWRSRRRADRAARPHGHSPRPSQAQPQPGAAAAAAEPPGRAVAAAARRRRRRMAAIRRRSRLSCSRLTRMQLASSAGAYEPASAADRGIHALSPGMSAVNAL